MQPTHHNVATLFSIMIGQIIRTKRRSYVGLNHHQIRRVVERQFFNVLIDYRDLGGQFDHIVSIEMFEAVGEQYWPTYFAKIADVLKPGGRAGLQIITIKDELFATYRKRADFIQRYVFPGGMLASVERLKEETAKAGFDLVEEQVGTDRVIRLTVRRWA